MDIEEHSNVEQSTVEKSKGLRSLELYLKIGGFAGIIFGLIQVGSIVSQGFTAIRLGDAIINSMMGILFLVCAKLVSNGRLSAMWVFGSTILISLVYSFAVGRGLNYIYALFGVFVIAIFVSLKSNNELS